MSSEVLTETPKPRGKKSVVMIGAVLVVVVGVAGLWFSGILGHLTGRSRSARSGMVAEQPILVDLPDIISNLDNGIRRSSFIKLHAKLKVMHAADAATVQANLPQILDIFQAYLRSTRPDELRGGEGTYRLREALINRIDAEIAPVQVTDLFFTELLVQ